MKVYVSELPKSCNECDLKLEISNDGKYRAYKCPFKEGCLAFGDNHYARKCPLKSLAEHDKQVRKEVCEQIKDIAWDYFELPICYNCGEPSNDDVILTCNDLTEILDQIEGEDNE